MKTHGDADWESFPSYLDVVVPRVLQILKARNLTITFFVVGQDAALDKNHAALRAIADAGHEIGNHSFAHEPWLHLYSPEQIRAEFDRAEAAIAEATGRRPVGFRGPGFSFSPEVLAELARRDYRYDCSTFPTFLGPLARLYYFFTSRLSRQQKEDRKQLFGRMREGFRSLRPYQWKDLPQPLVEIPVTTMPLFKLPIHLSYLLYLGKFSPLAARWYFNFALLLCRLLRIEPSILLHPLDFLGCDDECDLSFFPAMDQSAEKKLAIAAAAFDSLQKHYEVVPMHRHAELARQRLSANREAPASKDVGRQALAPSSE